jgi:hypothetical protein
LTTLIEWARTLRRLSGRILWGTGRFLRFGAMRSTVTDGIAGSYDTNSWYNGLIMEIVYVVWVGVTRQTKVAPLCILGNYYPVFQLI